MKLPIDWEALALDAAERLAKAGVHLKPKEGGYVGGPPGVTDSSTLKALRRRLDKASKAGREGYPWYREAREANAEMSGGDERMARALAAGQAVNSSRATPHTALGFTLAQVNASAEQGPEQAGKRIYYDRKKTAKFARVLQGEPPEETLGPKTGPYFRQMDPTDERAARIGVNDQWMGKLYGYPQAEKTNSGTFTPRQHEFMTGENLQAAARARRWLPMDAPPGVGAWQATAWVGAKKAALKAKYPNMPEDELNRRAMSSVRDAMDAHTAFETHELERGPAFGGGQVPPWQGERGYDPVYRALGMPHRPTAEGLGRFQPESGPVQYNPNFTARPMVSFGSSKKPASLGESEQRMMRAASAYRSVADQQESRAFHTVKLGGKTPTAARIVFSDRLPRTAERELYDLADRAGLDLIATGGGTFTLTGAARPEPLPSAAFRRAAEPLVAELRRRGATVGYGKYIGEYDVLPQAGEGRRTRYLLENVPEQLGQKMTSPELSRSLAAKSEATTDPEQQNLLRILGFGGPEGLRRHVARAGYAGLPAGLAYVSQQGDE